MLKIIFSNAIFKSTFNLKVTFIFPKNAFIFTVYNNGKFKS